MTPRSEAARANREAREKRKAEEEAASAAALKKPRSISNGNKPSSRKASSKPAAKSPQARGPLKPTSSNSQAQKRAGEKRGAGEKRAAEERAAKKKAANKRAAEKRTVKRRAAEKAAAEKRAAEKRAAERAAERAIEEAAEEAAENRTPTPPLTAEEQARAELEALTREADEEAERLYRMSFMSRWRVYMGERFGAPPVASNTRSMKFWDLGERAIWSWIDSSMAEQKGTYKRALATVYYSGQPKESRWVQGLNRSEGIVDDNSVVGDSASFRSLRELLKQLQKTYPEKSYCVDLDLYLASVIAAPGTQSSAENNERASNAGARRSTATRAQEEGLSNALAEQVATSGQSGAIIDRWRCTNDACENIHKVCWVWKQDDSHLDRFENHYPVGREILRIWDREIKEDQSTVQEPSDNVKIALRRAKKRRDEEEKRAKKASQNNDSSGDTLKTLSELVLANTLQQLQQQMKSGASTQHVKKRQRPSPSTVSSEDEDPNAAIVYFFDAWAHREPKSRRLILEIGLEFINDDWDLGSLLDPDSLTRESWDSIARAGYGLLVRMRRAIRKFRPTYRAHPDMFTARYYCIGSDGSTEINYEELEPSEHVEEEEEQTEVN